MPLGNDGNLVYLAHAGPSASAVVVVVDGQKGSSLHRNCTGFRVQGGSFEQVLKEFPL